MTFSLIKDEYYDIPGSKKIALVRGDDRVKYFITLINNMDFKMEQNKTNMPGKVLSAIINAEASSPSARDYLPKEMKKRVFKLLYSISDMNYRQGIEKLYDYGFSESFLLPICELYGKFKKTMSQFDLINAPFDDRRTLRNQSFTADGKVEYVPEMKTRECIYIAGPSGSGKSTYAADYIKLFQKIFPKFKVYVISSNSIQDDPALKDIDYIRVPLDKLDRSYKNSLVLFDDTDTIKDRDELENVRRIRDDLLETGRHSRTYVVITSHLLTSGHDSRRVLNECHAYTIFPNSGAANQIERLLKTYVGMNTAQIKKIQELGSRWVTIKKTYPQIVIYDRGAYLI